MVLGVSNYIPKTGRFRRDYTAFPGKADGEFENLIESVSNRRFVRVGLMVRAHTRI